MTAIGKSYIKGFPKLLKNMYNMLNISVNDTCHKQFYIGQDHVWTLKTVNDTLEKQFR